MMKPNKVFAFIGSALWILNPFLLFITFFKESIQMNIGMSWMGKFHPLLLHFPLVFGILIGLYLLFIPAGKLARTHITSPFNVPDGWVKTASGTLNVT